MAKFSFEVDGVGGKQERVTVAMVQEKSVNEYKDQLAGVISRIPNPRISFSGDYEDGREEMTIEILELILDNKHLTN